MPFQEFLEHWAAQAREQLQRLPYATNLPFMPEPVKATPAADSWLSGRLEDLPRSILVAVWPLALLVVWYFVLGENDQPIRYRVPSPKSPEREEILPNPTVKV